MEYRGYTR